MAEKQQRQLDLVIETAGAIDADEDMKAFRAKLGAIARQRPKGDAFTPAEADGGSK